MNIRDLKYLTAVAELRHFGKAAEACFVSQPTLSTQLKKLEDELGITVFERNNKNVMLTEVGKTIVEQAQKILREVDNLKDIAALATDPLSGPFRIGFIPTLGPYILPHIIPALKKAYPKCEFYLIEEKTDAILAGMKDGKLDAAVLALPIHDPNLVIEPLFTEPFLLAASKSHALKRRKTAKISDLESETLLLLEEGHCLRDQALEFCASHNIHEKTGFRATSLETLRYMVAAGSGVTLLPQLAIQTPGVTSQLSITPFAKPAPHRDIAMIWRNYSPRIACCEAIAHTIRDTIKPLLKEKV